VSVPKYPLVGALAGEPEPLLPVALVVLLLRYLLHLHTHTRLITNAFPLFDKGQHTKSFEEHPENPGSLNPYLDPGFRLLL
jgi:hypothetical protein